MSLEDLTGTKYIDSLDSANPLSADDRVEGDDHIRGIKNTIKNTFPNVAGAVTADHTELSLLDGVTAGTAVASKALAVDANKDIDLGTGDVSATDVTATGSLVGTLATGAQPSVTEVGTLTAGNVDAAVSAASPTTAGKIATATQAEVDAGTVTDEAVTPATLANYSGFPAFIVAAVSWDGTTGTTPTGACTINGNDLNVSTVTHTATGEYTVNFSSALPDANYCVLCSGARDLTAPDSRWSSVLPKNRAAGSVDIQTSASNTNSRLDYEYVSVVIVRI